MGPTHIPNNTELTDTGAKLASGGGCCQREQQLPERASEVDGHRGLSEKERDRDREREMERQRQRGTKGREKGS